MLACDWLHLDAMSNLFANFNCHHPHSFHDTPNFFHLSYETLSIDIYELVRYPLRTFFLYSLYLYIKLVIYII